MQKETHVSSLEGFMTGYAPFSPSENDVDSCVDSLAIGENSVLLKLVDADGVEYFRWRDFFDTPRVVNVKKLENGNVVDRSPHLQEPAVFRPMTGICQAIGAYTLAGREVSCTYAEDPNRTTASNIKGGTHKVDAMWELIKKRSDEDATGGRHTANVAVDAAYKLSKDPMSVYKNRLQAVSSGVHAMNNDPIRTHAYSITIEDSRMAMWYWSRSHSVKSSPFIFAKSRMTKADVSHVVAAIMSIMFATQEELGYDPDIQRFRDPGELKPYYVFRFKQDGPQNKPPKYTYYRSIESLFELPTVAIGGRATRVWKVQETTDSTGGLAVRDSKPMVLKDAWLDESVDGERLIQQQIFEGLDTLAAKYAAESAFPASSPPIERIDRVKFRQNCPDSLRGAGDETIESVCECLEQQKYKRYFTTIVKDRADGPVTRRLRQPGEGLQHVNNLFRCPPPADASVPLDEPLQMTIAMSMSGMIAPTTTPASPRDFKPRRRYWVLYLEVCVAVENLTDFKTVFTVMKDGPMALRLLALAKWIHRDISGGNMLGYCDPTTGKWRGILSDLEYAIRQTNSPRTVATDPKTGTAAYMAVEVQSSASYRFVVAQPDHNKLHSALARFRGSKRGGPMATKVNRGTPGTTAQQPGVKHTIYHDAESFMWLTLRFLADRVAWPPSIDLSVTVFQHSTPAPTRKADLLVRRQAMEELKSILHPAFCELYEWLENAAATLFGAYLYPVEAEATPDDPIAAVEVLILAALEECDEPNVPPMLTRAQSDQLKASPSSSSSLKRRRADDEDDADGGAVSNSAASAPAELHRLKATRLDISDSASSGRSLHRPPHLSDNVRGYSWTSSYVGSMKTREGKPRWTISLN